MFLIALSESYVKLSRHYHCRDDMFSIVAKMDDMCIILVNTIPQNEQLRYRVYTPTGVTLHCVQPYRRCKTLFNRYDIWAKAYEEWDWAAHTSVHYILPMKIPILQDPVLLIDGIEAVSPMKNLWKHAALCPVPPG